ncbi:hypothetical protein [Vulcanisaeta distributa]|uniref:hypothetical protein n=1 Tax=Vulcanisaeta distributa TaxID=164451 RepID=UPI0006D1F9BA|nr:hypothetical protein [Vulcanisaeta distributa]
MSNLNRAMNSRIITVLIIVSLLVIIMIMIQQLIAISHNKNYEIDNASNTMNVRIVGNYNGNDINYTMIMIEKDEIAKNRHVIRLCNG